MCPCCNGPDHAVWASESGFDVVKCGTCGLLFVHPMPSPDYVDEAVKTGTHGSGAAALNVRSRRIPSKVRHYQRRLRPLIQDVLDAGRPVTWVDVGSGYGELLEALGGMLPAGSRVMGVEPMVHKADAARSRGLEVVNDYLKPNQLEADFISNMDVFSHIPDYHGFLATVVTNLRPGGSMIVETGNTADLPHRGVAPNELGLPDHLVFAGHETMQRYFSQAGLSVAASTEERFDTAFQMAKNLVKLLIGRKSFVCIPYTSPYRQVIYRATLKG